MNGRGFDAITRQLAHHASRRGILRTWTAGVASGIAGIAIQRSGFAQSAGTPGPGETHIALYEEFEAIASNHHGTCDELAAKFKEFTTNRKADIDALIAEQKTWTREQRLAFDAQYGDRLEAASDRITRANFRCRFVGITPATPGATPEAQIDALMASTSAGRRLSFTAQSSELPATQQSCDESACAAWCEGITTGDCILSWGACLGGGGSCPCCMTVGCYKEATCTADCESNCECQSACANC